MISDNACSSVCCLLIFMHFFSYQNKSNWNTLSSAVLLHNPASPHPSLYTRGQGGITEGLVKGALSVAASAYKALFTGPNCSIQVQRTATLLSAVFKSIKTYITVAAAAKRGDDSHTSNKTSNPQRGAQVVSQRFLT